MLGLDDTLTSDMIYTDQIPLIQAVSGRPQQTCGSDGCGHRWIYGSDVPQLHALCDGCEKEKMRLEAEEEKKRYATDLVKAQYLRRVESSRLQCVECDAKITKVNSNPKYIHWSSTQTGSWRGTVEDGASTCADCDSALDSANGSSGDRETSASSSAF